MNRRQRGNVVGWLLGAVLLVAAVVGIWQHQLIADSVRAWQFEPSPAVSRLADDTTMTERGRMLFYASQSQLQPAEQFNQSCENVEKSSAVLGCYANRQIFIYDIDNAELAGIKEVTAAHEMLHAAYDRLSGSQRRDVDRMLDVAAERLRSNDAFQQRIEAYDFQSVDERYNELHSIIGTEIADLQPVLEQYYTQYFTDRSRVVELYRQYSDVFRKYQDRAERMASTLDAMASQINAENERYNQAIQQLNRDIAEFNAIASARGGFASQQSFEMARNAIVSRQTNLERDRSNIESEISAYSQLLEQYNGTARHLTSLNNSLDSRVAPTPRVDL